MTSPTVPAGSARTVIVAGGSSVLGALPAFLVGSLAIFVREDLGFGRSQLGLAVGAFFLASAAAAIPGGRLTERIGARRAMLGAAAVSGSAMIGLAAIARSWGGLLVWMVLAGAANGVAQPAGNLALARGIAVGRQGFAFGIKQAAIPAATLIAGAAVPLVGLTVGWQWAFVGAAGGAVALALVMPSDPYISPAVRSGRPLREGDAPILPLVVLAIAAACGAAVGTSLASFYVDSAVDSGIAAGTAGLLLVSGSVAGILSRLAVGWFADRRDRGHLNVVTLLLGLGAVGFAGLAVTRSLPAVLLATLLAFGAGWGWPGLFNFTIVKLNRNAPAAATAITQTGVFAGGVIGPAAFGSIAETASFTVAWTVAALLNVIAGICVVAGRRMLRAAKKSAADDPREPPDPHGTSPAQTPETNDERGQA